MKVLSALTLVAAIALAQGRSAVISNAASEEEVDVLQHEFLVNIRSATNNGQIQSGAGVMVNHRWVLTAAPAVNGATFIWLRWGAHDAIRPKLVTETSAVIRDVASGLALVGGNRYVHSEEYIHPIRIETAAEAIARLPEEAVPFASWSNTNNLVRSSFTPVNCINDEENTFCALGEASRTADLGAPLVVNGAVVGILIQREEDADATIGNGATFIRVGPHEDWIRQETGMSMIHPAEEAVETVQVAELEAVPVSVVETVQVAEPEAVPVSFVETVQVAELEATPVNVVETVQVAELEATPVNVVETVQVAELEATPVSVVETAQVAELEATPVSFVETVQVAELEATPVNVVETVQVAELEATPVNVVETVQVAELEATPVNVVETVQVAELEAVPVYVVETVQVAELEAVPVYVVETVQVAELEAVPVSVMETVQVAELRETVKVAYL